jgi:hypothetical protein
MASLEAGLAEVRRSPADDGVLRMIVRRPGVDLREILERGELDLVDGLLGDCWKARPSSRTRDGSAHPDLQLNLMNARAIAMIAGGEDRWALAGDQLYVDLDLSAANLPAGTRLAIGDAVIEVTAQPHTGCAKFWERFGGDALRLVNSPTGRELNLRGICARVVRPGSIARGDRVRKVERPSDQVGTASTIPAVD